MRNKLGRFVKGHHSSPQTEWKKGQTPKGSILFKKGTNSHNGLINGEKWHSWKSDKVGYVALHEWVRKKLGEPKKCSFCKTTIGKFEWANKSHTYKRISNDWIRLCRNCHMAYDKGRNWGIASKLFPVISGRRNNGTKTTT